MHFSFTSLVIGFLLVPLDSFHIKESELQDCKSDFNYDVYDPIHGPNVWSTIKECNQKCNGPKQSPINIYSTNSVYDGNLQWEMINLYNKRVPAMIFNNGHTAQFEGLQEGVILTSKGPDAKQYNFEGVHFHVGPGNITGSEHTIDGHSCPSEVHMIFYNSAYGSFKMATKKSDGLLVLAVHVLVGTPIDALFYTTRSRCNARYAKKLSEMIEYYVPWVTHYQSKKPLFFIEEGISPADALPYSWTYFTYNGSLTTPPCYESVMWMVMDCPIMVSQNAYDLLLSIEDYEGHYVRDYGNRRPIQTNTITNVYRNFHVINEGLF